MSTNQQPEQDEHRPKLDEKEKIGKKRAIKQRLHEYSSTVDIKPLSILEANIPCTKCGATPSKPGRPGFWYCNEHFK